MPRIESISRASSRQRSGCATAFLVVFLGMFVVIGCGIGYFLSARPLYQVFQAQSWTPTPCEVISSRVVHNDDTSRPEIVYRYEVGGRAYTADRYNFLPGTNNDRNVPEVVARHSAGTKFECYVDPSDPTRAVIDRTATLWYGFGLLFFFMFAGIPGGIGLVILYGRRRVNAAATQALSGAQAAAAGGAASGFGVSQFGHAFSPAPGEAGPIVLKPSSTPLGKLIGVTFVCLFWNGIVGIFTFFEYQMFMKGDSVGWFLAIFLLVFQLVGLALLVAVPYQLLALGNPRPIITLSRGSAPLGGTVSFTWELSGAAHRVSELTISLRGREEARYRRGTDTHTDTNVFFDETLVSANHGMNIARGTGTIRVPANSMHTFTADNNKVIWTLQVKGEIARWPNIQEDFDIVVRPA